MSKSQDQELQDYLQGQNPLSDAYSHASHEQPAADLDDKILAASRQEVRAKPGIAYSPFSSNWHVPASLAAVLVLSVTVVVTIQQEPEITGFNGNEISIGEPKLKKVVDKQNVEERAERELEPIVVASDTLAQPSQAQALEEGIGSAELLAPVSQAPLPGDEENTVDVAETADLTMEADKNNLNEVVNVPAVKAEDEIQPDGLNPLSSRVVAEIMPGSEDDHAPEQARQARADRAIESTAETSDLLLQSRQAGLLEDGVPGAAPQALTSQGPQPRREENRVGAAEVNGIRMEVADSKEASDIALFSATPTEADGMVLAEMEMAERQPMPVSRLLDNLVGQWSGTYSGTGEEYSLRFSRDDASCVYGLAVEEISPAWIFCETENRTRLTLTGHVVNREGLIAFIQTSGNDGIYRFAIETPGQQGVSVNVDVGQGRINILNNGSLFMRLRKLTSE